MALVYHDRIAEIVTTEGTGSFTLTGSVPTGYRAFTVLTATNTCYYHCNNQLTNEWEVGLGTYSAGVLTRDSVTASSSFNNKVDFTAGSKTLSLVIPSVAVQGMIDAIATSGDTTLIWSHEVTGAAVSEVEATGLDINTHKGYKVVGCVVSSGTAEQGIRLFVNADETTTNYKRRYIKSTGSTASTTSESNSGGFSVYTSAGQVSFGVTDVTLVNGYLCINGMQQNGNTANAYIDFVKKTASVTNVTSIQIKADSGTPIGIGSKFYIFKKGNR